MKIFKCYDIGEFKEYVGCKTTQAGNTIKFTQPVLLQSHRDEFKIPNSKFDTLAQPG